MRSRRNHDQLDKDSNLDTGSQLTYAWGMIYQEEVARKEYLRKYLRSTHFRILCWLSAGLTIISIFVSSYRLWLLYAACGISFAAMWPALRILPYRRKIDLRQKNEQKALLIVVLYVAAIILGAIIYGLYRSSH